VLFQEAANGSSEPHKHSSSNLKEHKHKHWDESKSAAPEQAEPQGKPWLAEHILVKIIDKRLQDGRYVIGLQLTCKRKCLNAFLQKTGC